MSASDAFVEGLLLESRRPKWTVPLVKISEFTSALQHKIKEGLYFMVSGNWFLGTGPIFVKVGTFKIYFVSLAMK